MQQQNYNNNAQGYNNNNNNNNVAQRNASLPKIIQAAIMVISYIPSDKIKTILQARREIFRIENIKHPSTMKFLLEVIKKEFFLGLWNGTSGIILKGLIKPPISRLIDIIFNPIYLKLRKSMHDEKSSIKRFLLFIINNLFNKSILMLLLLQPINNAQEQLFCDLLNGGKRRYGGVFNVLKQTYQKRGISGLYSGILFSLLATILYRLSYFILYDAIKHFNIDFLEFLPVIFSSIISYPFFTLQTRMVISSNTNYRYKNSLDAFKSIVKNDGVFSLFDGISFVLFRILFFSLVMDGH